MRQQELGVEALQGWSDQVVEGKDFIECGGGVSSLCFFWRETYLERV